MRLGIIAQPYNTGLGNIAWGFAENFESKSLLVMVKPLTPFPARFPNHRITPSVTDEDIDWLLTDIDVLFTIETPYNWKVYEAAKKRGITTVLAVMGEWLQPMAELRHVDVLICPSEETNVSGPGKKVVVPTEVPVNLKRFTQRVRKQAKTFLHNSGHGGVYNRNSTPELIEAIKHVKSDVRFIINSQYPITNKVEDPRIVYNEANFENYWDLYHEGDVWILPAKYGYAYLGIQESAACGMGVAITDMVPFNRFLPKDLLLPAKRLANSSGMFPGGTIQMAEFDPLELAAKIDELSTVDLSPISERMLELAHEWSWDVWRPRYEEIFKTANQ